jgi:hypothetical protein
MSLKRLLIASTIALLWIAGSADAQQYPKMTLRFAHFVPPRCLAPQSTSGSPTSSRNGPAAISRCRSSGPNPWASPWSC